MADGINPKHLDKRTTERYQRGNLEAEEAYKKHLEELPDVAEKGVPIETLMGDEVDDLDDDEDDDLDEEDDADDEADDADDAEESDEEDKAAE
ncbi:hypothetical protein D7X74_18215 [Corallococcus sp. CA047B]|uniref:hypothetical protein n=1 Tax=Corallococcus sp. CA047B TaxID=2316729 RepID=UPI000EA0AA04|nr:hypothetical protein [Corallococcus sp. CA047B]RKH15521.1 hypothetical protein D7X74_18215 [Corallococcus sp. CA047B]